MTHIRLYHVRLEKVRELLNILKSSTQEEYAKEGVLGLYFKAIDTIPIYQRRQYLRTGFKIPYKSIDWNWLFEPKSDLSLADVIVRTELYMSQGVPLQDIID